ncbi:extracellular solute-binding protein [Treponema sp.]|uniref:extracellular solute-binding protein n=1 Tax=Treponema sp. TaxID=166 RepID=UPI0038903A05
MKKILGICAAALFFFSACSKDSGNKQIVIYSNADDEAVVSVKKALDGNGYEGKYIFQSFGTSELGGKLFAEGSDIEADVITMSSFYIESAQTMNDMFLPLTFERKQVSVTPDFYTPLLAIQGAVIYNSELVAKNTLPVPTSIKDIGNMEYNGLVSVVDPMGSTTAWLMVQALISEYGEAGTSDVLKKIYNNAGPHLELSGSGPIKKIRSGEVAVGFGLRHQAVRDKKKGLPIDFIDPKEGNFALTESVAVINKGKKTNPFAMEIAKCIIENSRADIIKDYPVVLYDGESVEEENRATNSKIFAEPLTTELLKKHQQLSESVK